MEILSTGMVLKVRLCLIAAQKTFVQTVNHMILYYTDSYSITMRLRFSMQYVLAARYFNSIFLLIHLMECA